ncbi:MAG: SIMPL domain-containing protein [Candidatus Nitrosocaldus sp.]|nr:SIMPL domain-containing protein [Candidatus Nitrosocaldus sp.]MDW8000564.1 SIMPL domain-containing protein [Candidatus Nitrosocaldus sp.]
MARGTAMASRMSKRAVGVAGVGVVVALTLLLASVAVQYNTMDARAQEQAGNGAGRTELSVVGSATQGIRPDRASISVGVEVQEKTAGDAARRNAEIMSSIIEAVKAVGIREDQISTNYYSIYPVYEPRSKAEVCIAIYPPPPECLEQVLVGYRVVNNITITMELDRVQNIGRVIDAAVNAGANQVYGVTFFISQERLDAVRTSLLEKAAKDARIKAESVASALEMRVVGVKSVNIIDGYYPVPVHARVDAQATTPIMPSEQSVSASVQVTFLLE